MSGEQEVKKPHQAAILIRSETMEVLHSGQVSGVPVSTSSRVYSFTGNTLEECQIKVDAFLINVALLAERTENSVLTESGIEHAER